MPSGSWGRRARFGTGAGLPAGDGDAVHHAFQIEVLPPGNGTSVAPNAGAREGRGGAGRGAACRRLRTKGRAADDRDVADALGHERDVVEQAVVRQRDAQHARTGAAGAAAELSGRRRPGARSGTANRERNGDP